MHHFFSHTFDSTNFNPAYNSINGTIPTELGRLKQAQTIHLGKNLFRHGTWCNSFPGMNSCFSIILAFSYNFFFFPEYNKLTGSVPQELLNVRNTDIYVYSNQLSGLIPVEGDAICSAEGGEHYCNCGNDCQLNQNHCRCEEGQSCCASFLDQFTECIVCENSEFQNPDFYVKEIGVKCSSAANHVRESLVRFGTDEQCEKVKMSLNQLGCSCLGEDPNANTFDIPSPPAGEGPNANTLDRPPPSPESAIGV